MSSLPRIEPTLFRVLKAYNGTPFTRDELIKRYRNLESEHGRNSRASLQFIDRNLIRLTKAGVVLTLDDDTDKVRRYRYCSTQDVPPPATSSDPLSILRKKLQQQRIELLTTLGEAEAYDEVCSDLPELRVDVQLQYDEARDRSVKLLGRIRTIEALIAQQELRV
jgi:hypothetical protein